MVETGPAFVNYGGYTLEQGLASVGAGWSGMVEMAFAMKPENVKIVQVKEKFGGLRIYTSPYVPEYERFLSLLTRLASVTCEWCGQRGSMDQRYGWLLTLCEQCKRKRKRDKDKAGVGTVARVPVRFGG